MSNIIIPFKDEFDIEYGNFIDPKGEFVETYDSHEGFAREFINSELPKDISLLFKKWDDLYFYNAAGFLVQVLDWDKIESSPINTITTSSSEPHKRFYNYYLMDWNIVVLPKMKYDQEQDLFVPIIRDFNQILLNHEEDKHEEEIQHIKTLKKDLTSRKLFFK